MKGGGNTSKCASYFVQWSMVTNSCTVGEMQTTEEQEEVVL